MASRRQNLTLPLAANLRPCRKAVLRGKRDRRRTAPHPISRPPNAPPPQTRRFSLLGISIIDILIIDTVVMSSPEDHLPLTPAEFQVLLSLAEGERHGYALMQDVRTQTNGQLKIGPGTLYTLLDRLQSAGIIEESPRRPEQNEDQRRRYYRLTRLGKKVLAAEAQRLEALIRAARRRLSQHA